MKSQKTKLLESPTTFQKQHTADHSGYKMHTYVLAILTAYLKYLNKYVLTTNLSTYVKYHQETRYTIKGNVKM